MKSVFNEVNNWSIIVFSIFEIKNNLQNVNLKRYSSFFWKQTSAAGTIKMHKKDPIHILCSSFFPDLSIGFDASSRASIFLAQ